MRRRCSPRLKLLLLLVGVAAVVAAGLAAFSQAKTTATPVVTYLSADSDAQRNLGGVAQRLGLQLRVAADAQPHVFAVSDGDARAALAGGDAAALCGGAAAVVLGAPLAKARAALLALVDAADAACAAVPVVVVELARRFDYGAAALSAADAAAFARLVRRLVAAPPQNVVFVAASAFYIEDMRLRLGVAPQNYVIIKPLGISVDDAVAPEAVKMSDDRIGINPSIDRAIYNHFIEDNNQVAAYSGLPKHILRFKGYVEFPSHISSVDFYQRLAHGIPLVIPSPSLLKSLVEAKHHRLFPYFDDLNRMSIATNRSWSEFVDYYDKDIERFVYYFDTLDELEIFIKTDASKFDTKDTRLKAPEFFRAKGGFRDQVVDAWRKILLA